MEREGGPFRRVLLPSPNLSYSPRTFLRRGLGQSFWMFRAAGRDAVRGMGAGKPRRRKVFWGMERGAAGDG